MRFFIVGTGNVARTYYTAIGKLPEMEVAGFVSRTGRRPLFLDDGAQVEIARTLDDIDIEYDAVVLSTPGGVHYEGAVAAAGLGKHVLTEKPLDITVEHMDSMTEACRKAGVKLAVAYQRRMSPDNRTLKSLLERQALGRIFAADLTAKFYRDQAYYDSASYRGTYALDGGGPFAQQAAHNLDLYCWFFGMPEKVVSMLETFDHDIEVEDHGICILRHPDGMLGSIVASTVARPGFPTRMEIHAEKGSVVLENDIITSWSVDGLENPSKPPAGAIHTGATAAVTDTAGHEAILTDFVEAIREDREPAVTAESARLATELILRIYASKV